MPYFEDTILGFAESVLTYSYGPPVPFAAGIRIVQGAIKY